MNRTEHHTKDGIALAIALCEAVDALIDNRPYHRDINYRGRIVHIHRTPLTLAIGAPPLTRRQHTNEEEN